MADPSPRTTAPNDPALYIALSYLWLLSLVPLLTEKSNREVQWHAKHGFVMMVAEVAFWLAFTIFTEMLGAATLGLGFVVAAIGPLIGLVFLVVHGVAIFKGINGERLILPVISQFADRF